MADNINQPPAETSVKPKQVITPSDVRRRRMIMAVVLGGVILVLALFGWWYTTTYLKSPEVATRSEQQQTDFDQALQLAERANQAPDPAVKASQLAEAASLMNQARDAKRSLEYYQRAHDIVTRQNLGEIGLNFDKQIAEQYAKLGENAKARDHYDAAIAFFEKTTPQTDSMKAEIATIKKMRDQL